MSEYSHCSICGGSFIGIGNVCPGCEDALSREPLEIRPIELKTRRNSADEAARSAKADALAPVSPLALAGQIDFQHKGVQHEQRK